MNNKTITAIALILLIPVMAKGIDNKKYIDNEIANLDKLLEKPEFVKGTIFLNNDSVQMDLLLFKGKHKIDNYLFCVGKEKNDSIRIFYAEDILGYKIQNDKYISHTKDGVHFFIHKIKSGAIDLYEKKGIPSDEKLLYYIKIGNYMDAFIINPSENNITETSLPNSNIPNSANATVPYLSSKGINEKFKIFVSKYLGDCESVKNRVNSGFYTINDIPAIVESYNHCIDN